MIRKKMKIPKSKTGFILSAAYVIGSFFLIVSEGLFGESFIALLLGFPWSLIIIYCKITEDNPFFIPMLYSGIFLPIILNACLLYMMGFGMEKLFLMRKNK